MPLKNKLIVSAVLSVLLVACGDSDNDNDAPEFSQSKYTFSGQEDTDLVGAVSATDPENKPITYSISNQAANGALQLSADGSFIYVPNADFDGSDTVRIFASDGKKQTEVEVEFQLSAVNDAPTMAITDIAVASDGISTGQVQATDVDGDAITYELITPPDNGVFTFDTATGDFVYTPDELEVVGGEFVISYTDGVIAEPIIASIELTASFSTNADKLSYYYRSEKSHLKLATDVVDLIDDDITKFGLNGEIAKGYLIAGFSDRAVEILDSIGELTIKARAYRRAALVLDDQDQFTEANKLRARAEYLYNLHLAEKGLANISSSDSSFYLDLVNNYLDAGQADAAENLLSTVFLYAEAVREEKYNTPYGRFLTAFVKNAKSYSELYLETKLASDYERADTATKNLGELVEKTGYQIRKSGVFAGEKSDRIKSLYLTWTAELFNNIGNIEYSKKYTALAYSMYANVEFDIENTYIASENAVVNIATYTAPLKIISGLITTNYPALEPNPALTLIPVDDSSYNDAREYMFSYQALNAINEGTSVADAIAEAKAYFEAENDLPGYYKTLVE